MTVNRLITSLVQLGLWACILWCAYDIFTYEIAYRKEQRIRDAVNAAKKRQQTQRYRALKRLVFCDGSKRNVAWVELIDSETFYQLTRELSNGSCSEYNYGLIDMNNASIFFDVSNY